MKKEMSIKEKLLYAQRLACGLTQQITIPPEIEDIAWTHAEGYRAARIENHIQGRCSVAASLQFDLAEEERELDKEIALFEAEVERKKEEGKVPCQ